MNLPHFLSTIFSVAGRLGDVNKKPGMDRGRVFTQKQATNRSARKVVRSLGICTAQVAGMQRLPARRVQKQDRGTKSSYYSILMFANGWKGVPWPRSSS